MTAWLTEAERLQAIGVLRRLRPAQLREAVDRDVEMLVMQAEHTVGRYRSRLRDEDLPEFLVDSCGVDLLAGNSSGRQLRTALADILDDPALEELHAYQPGVRAVHSRTARVREVGGRNWHPGKRWARSFVNAVGLPPAFAGVAGLKEGPALEEVQPYRPLPPLHDYQAELAERLITLLKSGQQLNRGLLSLPTGAGKTRTAVDALTRWWAGRDVDRGCILWIAQSDELCEQAVQSVREAWVDRGHTSDERRSLPLHRLWGTRSYPELPSGVVVASIQKLAMALTDGASAEALAGFEALVEATHAVVVDEAHHTTAPAYRDVLQRLDISTRESGRSRKPLIGLTATPYRGSGVVENEQLARAFGRNLIVPSGLTDPIAQLREREILSHALHEALETHRPFALTASEEEQLEQFQRLPGSFLRRVGDDSARNRIILDRLMALPPEAPTLFFGCSVRHAEATAVLLRRNGRPAAAVSADTRPATRRYLVEQFRAGELRLLCNYGVLTTGFDAPKVAAVVIARPTTSPVLYEQMIGRGMRGPRNGGTRDCLVVDLIDNIAQFGGQMAYTRFSEYWR